MRVDFCHLSEVAAFKTRSLVEYLVIDIVHGSASRILARPCKLDLSRLTLRVSLEDEIAKDFDSKETKPTLLADLRWTEIYIHDASRRSTEFPKWQIIISLARGCLGCECVLKLLMS